MKVSQGALQVLSEGEINGNVFYIRGDQLDRKLYLEVNDVLTNIGGKWNRGQKGHVFDEEPSGRLDEVLLTGETINEKKLYQFFETPRVVAERVVELAEIQSGMSLLEPEAGRGALLDAISIKDGVSVTAIELDPKHLPELRDKGYDAINMDFMAYSPASKFDRIIMNPPFTKQQDIKHVLHAYDMLAEGGRLVAIMSPGFTFRQDKLSRAFNQLVEERGAYEELSEGAFKESGTNVRTVIVALSNKQR